MGWCTSAVMMATSTPSLRGERSSLLWGCMHHRCWCNPSDRVPREQWNPKRRWAPSRQWTLLAPLSYPQVLPRTLPPVGVGWVLRQLVHIHPRDGQPYGRGYGTIAPAPSHRQAEHTRSRHQNHARDRAGPLIWEQASILPLRRPASIAVGERRKSAPGRRSAFKAPSRRCVSPSCEGNNMAARNVSSVSADPRWLTRT